MKVAVLVADGMSGKCLDFVRSIGHDPSGQEKEAMNEFIYKFYTVLGNAGYLMATFGFCLTCAGLLLLWMAFLGKCRF